MGAKSELYRQKMAECEQMAKGVADLSTRRMFLDLAAHWREMAERAEGVYRSPDKLLKTMPD